MDVDAVVDVMMSAARPYGVYVVDPGGTTGVARGVFLNQDTSLVSTIRSHFTTIDAWEVEGDAEHQAWEIVAEFADWAMDLRAHGIPDIDFVFERFQPRQRNFDITAIEIIGGAKTLLIPRDTALETGRPHVRPFWKMVYQEPSEAMGFATSKRLKLWGLYALGRGSEHKRDALRHLALRVAKRGG